jgi:riboflavin kinase, archaea type
MDSLRGRVVKGLGKGRYYVSREGYRKQFISKLGFDPSPGTLNLITSEPFSGEFTKCVDIEGFKDKEGVFGECKCYKIMICDIMCAIVRPERSNYPPDLLEVIAPLNLRKRLNLSDGDELDLIFKE